MTIKIRALLLGYVYFSRNFALLKRNVLSNRSFIDVRCLQSGNTIAIRGGGIWSRGEQSPAYAGPLHVLLVIHRVTMRVVCEAEGPLQCLVVVFR